MTLEQIIAATRAVATAARAGGDRVGHARALRAAAAEADAYARQTGEPHPIWGDGGVQHAAKRYSGAAAPTPPLTGHELLTAAAAVCQVWSEMFSDPSAPAGEGGATTFSSEV
jgi:hypothetical protein